ncbi:unnamed protein product [Echinostoma caproni]|uniref:Uncharacterized protein n=1 Tax=Echinostoma caproni TaxID=27848 RepID=A0A3P8HQG5_9TREM|nr:unnamed protein product [Echinostoma caproni]
MEESPRCLLWWFVSLPVERLHKTAQSMLRYQLEERVTNLNQRLAATSASDSQAVIFHSIDAAVTLFLVDRMPMQWRESNAERLAQLTSNAILKQQTLMNSALAFPCASWLSCAIRRPICTLIGHLSTWNPHLTRFSLNNPGTNSSSQMLQVS